MNDRSLKSLKFMVIFMGATLVVGILFLLKFANEKIKQSSSNCQNLEINLDDNQLINSLTTKDKLLLEVKKEGIHKFIVVDPCHAKRQTEILIKYSK